MKRALAVVAILVAGILSLPLAAMPFSSEGSENWILPVALVLMAAVGAMVSLAVPELAGPAAGTGRRAAIGAAVGIGAALVGTVVFFLLVSGVGGA